MIRRLLAYIYIKPTDTMEWRDVNRKVRMSHERWSLIESLVYLCSFGRLACPYAQQKAFDILFMTEEENAK